MAEQPFENIAIILKPSEFDDIGNLITNLCRWLHRRKVEITMLDREQERLKQVLNSKIYNSINFKDESFVYNKTDLIISLGGDGTLLGVYRAVNPKIPVFGVNLGRLGFITEFNKSDFYEKLNVVLAGKFKITKKALFSVTVNNTKGEDKYYFINDVVFSKNDIARIISLSITAEGEHIYNLSGDGLIISSTLGSTAYSLAAGGPIVHPEVNAILMTPICPHSLTHRPLVVPDHFVVTLQLMGNTDHAHVTIDGQNVITIENFDTITITKEKSRMIKVIKNEEKTYFHTLKEKFVHGRREA
jgi:NAD+ kinase